MSDITRVHYSANPVTKVFNVPLSRQSVGDKPRGLWYSVEGFGDDWKAWCNAEQFSLDCLSCQTELVVKMGSILALKTVADLDDFNHEYGTTLLDMPHFIDWGRVAKKYSGIEIAPYQWDRRLWGKCRWYYGWDCASGCIWRKDGIDLMHKTKEVNGD